MCIDTGVFLHRILLLLECVCIFATSLFYLEKQTRKKWDNAEKRVMPDEKNVMQFLFGATTNTVATRTSAHLN